MKIYSRQKFISLPKAVLLDLDNTLYSSDEAHLNALKAVKRKVVSSISVASNDFDSAYLAARRDVKKRLAGTAASHSKLLYFQKMSELVGFGSQPLLVLDLEQTYWRTFLDGAQVFDGVVEFLHQLRLLGIQTAIVTDLTSQIQLRKLVFLGLDELIDFVVTSEEAGANKPEAAAFRVAIEKLRIQDGPVWMIGDSLEKDIRGSREAIGATTIWKTQKSLRPRTFSDGPDASVRQFTDLVRLLKKLSRHG